MNTHDCTNRSAREWYLPHHPVINPNKPGKVRRVLSQISSQVKEILSSEGQESHVLGLKWDHVLDTLVVGRGVNRELKDTVTQRTVLSFVSSVFDPIGLVAPYTVRARLLLKEIWRISGQQWDNPLPLDLNAKFLEWRSGLTILS